MKKIWIFAVAALLAALMCLTAFAEEDGFRLAAKSDRLEMYINEETLEMRIRDLLTDEVRSTKIMNGASGNKTTKNSEKSDLRVYYIVNETVGTTNSMDSYSMSVSYSNYNVEYIENGVEIRYEIGDMTITVDDLPKMVPVEKYNTMLLPNWAEKDDKAFREYYRIYKDTMWVRTDDGNIGKVKLNNLYSLFYEKSPYTHEDLVEDNAAYGYEIENVNPRVDITIRFTLDGDDLLVTVPMDTIEFTNGNPVTRVDVLPYFMTAGTEDEGYIFVPDGSGSLIYLNNGKVTALSYTDRVYGSDPLMNVATYSPESDAIKAPVYGIKTANDATLAIIEKGAEIASVYADISGRSDEFNRVYSYFTVRDLEFVSVIGTASGSSPRYPEDLYDGDVVIRYKFLTGEDANYVGMAKAYREYLLSRGMLSEREMPEEAPLFAELIGAVRKTKFFVGVPYESTAVATTLKQGLTVVDALAEAGVKNLKLLLNGYLEGGIKHESLQKLSLESSTGSKKDLSALREKAEEIGGSVYLMLNGEKVYTTDNFNKRSQASRRQDNFIASVVNYAEPILAEERGYTDSFYVSPAYLAEYAEKIDANLEKSGLDVNGIALEDVGNLLISDYRRKGNISRIHATDTAVKAMETLAEGRGLIVNAPNDYAMRFADAVYNLPDSDNGHKVEDEAVPFLQLVLDGSCVYTTGAWNESAYTGVWRELNYAIETKSAPYFRLSFEDETVFLHTEDNDSQNFFMTRYEQWLDEIESAYAEYAAFWALTKDARVRNHEIVKNGLRRVTWDNGVTVYVNYRSQDEEIDGLTVPAQGYLVTGGMSE